MQLSEHIKNIRQRAFLSQEKYAKELDVSISTVIRWENGKSCPNLTAMKKIKDFCKKYELPFNDIEEEWFKLKDN